MRTCLLGLTLCIALLSTAQRQCATADYVQEQKQVNPSMVRQLDAVEAFIQQQVSRSARLTGDGAYRVIRIPVVVHLLYNSPEEDITDAQVKSQVDALNRDYRKKNSDTVNIPLQFKPYAADVQIEFELAKADPSGRPTSGIVRKPTSATYWTADDKIKYSAQGGDDAWDSRYYYNIWVGSLRTLLGYASVPGGAAEKDGVVINTSVFGTLDKGGPYNMGRTLVHETGHWLGLHHIWGETYCGDDGVDDTPRQGSYTSGCPSTFRSTCDNGSTGDMYMNYMDYTNDACMSLFTLGQKQRMLALFTTGGPRNGLLASKGLADPWNEETVNAILPDLSVKAQLFPNPARTEATLQINTAWIGKTIQVLNANGVVVSTLKVSAPVMKINVSTFKSGVYFIQGQSGDQKLTGKLVVL